MGDALELAWGGARLQGDSVWHWTRGELLIVLHQSSGDKGEGVADETTDEVLFCPSLFPTPCQREDTPPRSLPSNSREELNIALSIGAFYGSARQAWEIWGCIYTGVYSARQKQGSSSINFARSQWG